MTIDVFLDINVVLWNFPNGGNEMVLPNEDGSYTIFLNSRLSKEQQQKAYIHALKHLKDDDFQKDDVQSIESNAHNE